MAVVSTYPEESTMDRTYWKAAMSEANDAVGAARDSLARAKTAAARRRDEEDLEFWTNRRAFLTAVGEVSAREVVSVGLDGQSNPMLRYRDELPLADHLRSQVR